MNIHGLSYLLLDPFTAFNMSWILEWNQDISSDWTAVDCQLILYDTFTQQAFNFFKTIPCISRITFHQPILFPIVDGSKKTNIKKGIRVRVFPIEIIKRNQKKNMKTINDDNGKHLGFFWASDT